MPDDEIVEGWSGPLDYQLLEDGSKPDLTGDTLTAEAVDRDRNEVTLTGDLAQLTATDGTVRLTPDTGDFPASGSPYELRFKRALSGGGVVYYPSGEPITLRVRSWV